MASRENRKGDVVTRSTALDTVRNLKKMYRPPNNARKQEEREQQKTSDTELNKSNSAFKRTLTFEEQLEQIQSQPQARKTPLGKLSRNGARRDQKKSLGIAQEIIQHNNQQKQAKEQLEVRKFQSSRSLKSKVSTGGMSGNKKKRLSNRTVKLKRSVTQGPPNNVGKSRARREQQKSKKPAKLMVKDPLKVILMRSKRIKSMIDEGEFSIDYINRIKRSKPF